jgi:hypothetical protein
LSSLPLNFLRAGFCDPSGHLAGFSPAGHARHEDLETRDRKLTKRAVCFFIATSLFPALAAGAQPGPRPPRVESPRAVYELQGITINPPQGQNWYVLRRDREAVFFGKKVDSPTHAFAATAITQLVQRTFNSPEEFLEFVKQAHGVEIDPVRQRVLENDAALDGSTTRYCVRYHIKTEDGAARGTQNEPLITVNYGVTCMHPTIPQLLVDVGYSERGRQNDLDPELRAEGDSVVRSLRFTGVEP